MSWLVELLLPVGLWILKSFFQKMENDKEAKKQFLIFVDAMERDQLASVKLNDDDRAQLAELKRRRELLRKEL